VKAEIEPTRRHPLLDTIALDPEWFGRVFQKLIRFFAIQYCPDPSELAGETISRVFTFFADDRNKRLTSKLDTFIFGVAKHVAQEDRRRRQRVEPMGDGSEFPAPTRREPFELEVWEQETYAVCLERCLGALGEEQRHQILLFYEGNEEGELKRIRQELADKLRTNTRALGLRMLRVRGILRTCVSGCVEETQRRKTTESSLRDERGL
jgi:DNA-directed RNA polymerase specialized sigma24 family protein